MRKNKSIRIMSLDDRRALEGKLPYRYCRKPRESNLAYYSRLLTILSFSGEQGRPLHNCLLEYADRTWRLLSPEEQRYVNDYNPTRTQHHTEPKE